MFKHIVKPKYTKECSEQIEQAVVEISSLEYKHNELEKQVQDLNQKITVLTLENNQMKIHIKELDTKIEKLVETLSQAISGM